MITSTIEDSNVAGISLSSTSLQNDTSQSVSTPSLIQNILNQLKAHDNQELANKQQEQHQQISQQQQQPIIQQQKLQEQSQHQQQYQFEEQPEEVEIEVKGEELKTIGTTKQSQEVKDTSNQDQLREQLKSLLKSGQIRIRKCFFIIIAFIVYLNFKILYDIKYMLVNFILVIFDIFSFIFIMFFKLQNVLNFDIFLLKKKSFKSEARLKTRPFLKIIL